MTKSQKFVAESYAKYFGRAADADTIEAYGLKENGKAEKASVILRNIIDDSDYEKIGLSTEEFVNNAFQNLFGRNATTKEMNKYSKVVDKHKDLPINSIVKKAGKFDKAVNKNKLEVAVKYADLGGKGDLNLSKISKGNLVDLKTVVTLTDLDNAIHKLADNSGIPSSFDGKTFVLTEGVDAGKDFTGTNKDDLFIADNSVKVNASAADTLDGGKGVDTFKLYDDAAGAGTSNIGSLPTLKNIENVVIYDNQNISLDLKKWDTVETLFLVSSITNTTTDLGEKVTTVNFEDIAAANTQTLKFNDAVAAATIGVNKVGTVGATPAPATVIVDSAATAALKTLTINASGKASNVILDQNTTDTIETLNITGRADLTLAYATPAVASKIATIDGSKAQGKLDLSLANTNTTPATLKTVKTGTGDDTVTLNGLSVVSGATINLGAGNDKLVQGTAGTIAAGSIIDGGAGIDSLDSALVNFGNAGVFANFETISLTTAITSAPVALDLDLLTKSTITSIAKDNGAAIHFVKNVQKSQSLTINTNATAATTLLFKDATGTADAYTINFAKDAAAVAAGTTVAAGLVTIDGIETVTVNSTGKTTTTGNSITLNDKDAKSLVITGDKDLTVDFDTNPTSTTTFGSTADATNGLGVSIIDASASTAGITLGNLVGTTNTFATNLKVAHAGLTIKGGAGKDSITTGDIKASALTIETGAGNDKIDLSSTTILNGPTTDKIIVNAGAGDDEVIVGINGGTFTLGVGKDTIDVTAAVAAGTTVATGAIKTTITDIEKGDVIKGLTVGAGGLFAKADITGAVNLDDAFAKAANATNVTWFKYADGNTYIVDAAAAAFATGDLVVKLNGIVDIANSTFNAAGDLTIA